MSSSLPGRNDFLQNCVLVLFASVATRKQILVFVSNQSKKRQVGWFDMIEPFSQSKLFLVIKNVQKDVDSDHFAAIPACFQQ